MSHTPTGQQNRQLFYNPPQPFENFYNSLLAAPSTSGIDGTGIELATPQQFDYAVQALMAGLVVDFYPYTAGSPACVAECVAPFGAPFDMSVPEIVQGISNLDPGNPMITAWQTALANVAADEPTASQIQDSINLLQTGVLNLSPSTLDQVNAFLANINPVLPQLASIMGVTGGFNPDALLADLQTLDPSLAALLSNPDVTPMLDSFGSAMQMMTGGGLETLANLLTGSL